MLAFFGAIAVTMAVSDAAGYGLSWLMGVHGVAWPAKMVLRGGPVCGSGAAATGGTFCIDRWTSGNGKEVA